MTKGVKLRCKVDGHGIFSLLIIKVHLKGILKNQHKNLELSHAMENRGEKMDALLKSCIFAGVVVGFVYRFKS